VSGCCVKYAQLFHFAVQQVHGAGSATITTSVLLIVFAREESHIKRLDDFFLSLNALVCPGVVLKNYSSCNSPWRRHPAPAYCNAPAAATITTNVLLFVFARELRQIKQRDDFLLSHNALVCPGVVSKKHSSYISPWSRHTVPAYCTVRGAATFTTRVLLIVFARE
jgi:hypothetical protein